MLKRCLTAILLSCLLAISLLNISPVKATETNDHFIKQQNAPDRVWASATRSKEDFFTFEQRSFYGRIYRGYLTLHSYVPELGFRFEGYLYRDDLPYPIPYSKEQESGFFRYIPQFQ